MPGDTYVTNGPRSGVGAGRKRNTVINNRSHGKGFIPPVSPSDAIGLGSQTATARTDYLTTLANLRAQRAQLKGGFIAAKGAAREQRLADVSSAANAAAERGIMGSSIDLAGRAAAHTTFAENVAAARSERTQGILGLQAEKIGATSQYHTTLSDIEARRKAAQSERMAQMFEQDQYDAMQQNYDQVFQSLMDQIQAQKTGQAPRRRRGTAGGYVYGGRQQWSPDDLPVQPNSSGWGYNPNPSRGSY